MVAFRFRGRCRGCGRTDRPLASSDFWGGSACYSCKYIVDAQFHLLEQLGDDEEDEDLPDEEVVDTA